MSRIIQIMLLESYHNISVSTRTTIVDRELVHHVSSQEREVGHQWTHLNTKSFLAIIFLDMYSYTTTLYIQ